MRQIPRRRFVKGLFLGTAFSSILGKSWSSAYAAVFTPASQVATFQINVNDYPALQLQGEPEFGTVRLGANAIGSGENAFPFGPYYPIIINRDPSGFYVFNSLCKHAACVVEVIIERFMPPIIRCPCHFSEYDPRSGDVTREPATEGLTLHEFTFDSATNLLTVFVPQMGFHVASFLPNTDPGARLQLDFTAQGGTTYEVRFREKLTDPWAPVMFSLTPTGPATEQTLLGNGDLNRVYIERTTATGFYAVSMILSEV